MTARGRLLFRAKRMILLSAGLLAMASSVFWFLLFLGEGLSSGSEPGFLAAGGLLLVVIGVKMRYDEEDPA